MLTFKLILRNAFRHRLRACLTITGISIAIVAFGLLRTLVGLWYLGVESSSATRLVSRNSISLIFPLPLSYRDRIRQVPGVTAVSYGNWFGGIYINEKNFFPNFAVDAPTYLDLYPEFVLSREEKMAFLRDRRGAVAGKKLAEKHGWKLGDMITLKGTIFPGNWELVVRGIYRGAQKNTDETQLFFQWDYLNETLKKTTGRRVDQPGFYIIGVSRPEEAAVVSTAVDALFNNSLAETLTETERAFQMSFVAMTEAIMIAIEIVSYVVIAIIMIVAANTMAMTARERIAEYATLKTLGFGPAYITGIVVGESLTIAFLGCAVGVSVSYPAAAAIQRHLSQFFPIFSISGTTVLLDVVAAGIVGLAAAVFPAWRGSRIRIAEGFRRLG